jgi:CheY-like chemotaxis protein
MRIGQVLRCHRPGGLLLPDEGQQFVAADAVLTGGPVAPAVGSLDDGLVPLAVQLGFLCMDDLQVVQELQEHHPRQQRQPVGVAIEALVLAQDLARSADQGGQVLACGQGSFGLARCGGLLRCGCGGAGFGHGIVISFLLLLVQGALQA